MLKLKLSDVEKYVETYIGSFHKKRLDSLGKIQLADILKRKNPYLFRAKNILLAQDLVRAIMDAHLSSQEETIFGDFLEGLAIFICSKVYAGRKSSTVGVDLEFSKKGIRYLIAIKSGPNWGNSSQITKMKEDFRRAKKTLRTSSSNVRTVFVNGCCYGKDNSPDKGEYLKLCGQRFWEFISGDESLYIDIIKPLGFKAKEKNDSFLKAYSQMINQFTNEFIKKFCVSYQIDWDCLLKFNSSK